MKIPAVFVALSRKDSIKRPSVCIMASGCNAALSRRGLVFSVCPVAGDVRLVEPDADIDPGHAGAGEGQAFDKPAQRRAPSGLRLRRIPPPSLPDFGHGCYTVAQSLARNFPEALRRHPPGDTNWEKGLMTIHQSSPVCSEAARERCQSLDRTIGALPPTRV